MTLLIKESLDNIVPSNWVEIAPALVGEGVGIGVGVGIGETFISAI